MKKLTLTTIAFTITLLGCSKEELPVNEKSTTNQNLVDPPKDDTIKNQIKPADYIIVNTSYANLKVNPDFLYTAIDIEELTNNKSKFTSDFLKSFINITSEGANAADIYLFNSEEFKHVNIHEFNYNKDANVIQFKTSYKGVKSFLKSSIVFNSDAYYRSKIKINTDYVSKHYMRGIYEDLLGNIDHLLIYDHNKYTIELDGNSAYKEDYSDMLRFSFELKEKKKDKILARLSSDNIVGFKKIKSIGDEMKIYALPNFEDAVKEKIKKTKNIENTIDLTNKLKGIFVNEKWIQLTYIEVNKNRLSWRGDYLSGMGFASDIYLDSPQFILESAIRNGNDLMLKINLQQANEETIYASFDLVVKDIK